MAYSSSYFVPKNHLLFLSKIQKCIPKSWKKPSNNKPFHKPLINSSSSMIPLLIASLNDFVTHGHLSNAFKTFFHIQQHSNHSPSSFNLLFDPIRLLLLSCTKLNSLPQGKQLHAYMFLLGIHQNHVLVSKLLQFYANFNLIADAQTVVEDSNSFFPLHWNMVMSLYVKNSLFHEALSVYNIMLSRHVEPDDFTYPCILKACGELLDETNGVKVHKLIEASSVNCLYVHNALVSMYGRFGKLDVARHLFDNLAVRNNVSWYIIISCYASRGMWEEAFRLFGRMQEEGVEMNIIIWNTIAGGCLRSANFKGALKMLSQTRTLIRFDSVAMVIGLNACSHIGALKLGKEIHGHAVRTCFDVFDNVKNALITMYSRCRDLSHAYVLFRKMEEKGLITWNAMLSGYAHMDRAEEVSFLFREMLHERVEPNFVTIASVLPLCARIANLQHGKEFHCYMMKRKERFSDHLLLWNTLIDMYSRSGKVLEARKVFDSLSRRDGVTYTSMIFGYGMRGDGETALKLFEEMCRFDIKPDHVTMVAVLTACSHSGLIAHGLLLFKKMVEVYGMNPQIEHYSCMVDLFGRAGLLNKAKEVITGMPYKPTTAMWVTLIGACRIHGNTVMGEWAAGELLKMKPNHSGYYVLIANMYAAAGCWSKLAKVRICMRDLGVRKAPGCAWVDVGSEFSSFLVGDTSNSHSGEIYPLMNGLNELKKDAGYVPSEGFVTSEEDFE
uniref:Pentatricopeptide repeat-containing protein At1g71490-like n=1 Tax=Cicer arietinum TaxID=3827 RepID=A0A1S3E1K1_CICAR|nr:pentatricopeptide repeat-containing protein At1g71490-like [Cicer arietinum]XP_012569254.1 pentatricopeptide repeat-containing protein At1g71490-like [Cicer arietinum]